MRAGGQVTWAVGELEPEGLPAVDVRGAPAVCPSPYGPALSFDGEHDALVFDANPLAEAQELTLEALFMPVAGGAFEQRFVHIQSSHAGDRLLLETRMPEPDVWYADTYVCSGRTDQPLNDPALSHAAGQWYTMAMTLTPREMVQYVNGRCELSAPVHFRPIGAGRVSVGMRINGVYPFKGAIRAVRMTACVLPADDLLRP